MLSGLGPSSFLLAVALAAALLAGGWLWRRRRTGRAAAPTASRRLQDLKQRDVEALVRETFRLQGYTPIATPGGATDGGEIVLRRDRETMLVQCRHWRDARVGAEAVHAFQRTLSQRGAGSGFMLTTGRFARDAIAAASAGNVRLLDGPAVQDLLGKVVVPPAAAGR